MPLPVAAMKRAKEAHADPAMVQRSIDARKSPGDAARVAELYERFVAQNKRIEALRADRKRIAKKGGGSPEAIAEGRALKEQIAALEAPLRELEHEMLAEACMLPNSIHPDAPLGPEDNAEVVRTVGTMPTFAFPPRNHLEIGEVLDLFDLASASKLAASKFVIFRNDAVLLELALTQWALARAAGAGYTMLLTPDMAHQRAVEGCGFNPRGESSQVYSVSGTDLCLVGTGEIAIAGMHADTTYNAAELPLKHAAFSHCFRHEAGGAGHAGKGIYRLHQFSKVELFCVTSPADSDATLRAMVDLQCDMYAELGLHFRVLNMPTEELGASAYQKYDLEAWMPGRGEFGELCSSSNCTDYQSYRLGIRARYHDTATGKKRSEYAHTLNATACAVPRTMLALLETHQNEDGSVNVPVPLQPYLGGRTVLEPRQ